MLRLLSIEFHKLIYNRSSRNLIIAYFAFLILSIVSIVKIKVHIGESTVSLAEQGIFDFPYIWHFTTYYASFFKFFLLFVIVSMMANEYSYKTLKQNLIDGLSKQEFILSKFYTVIAFALISTIFVFLVSLILGLIYSDFTEISIIFTDVEYIFAYFIKLVGFFSMGLFFGILIKRSAFAVAGIIFWYFFEWLFFGLLKWLLPISWETAQKVKNFLPLEAMANLIKQPISRLSAIKSVAKQINVDISTDVSVHFSTVLIVLVWVLIFVFLSYKLLKSRDL